MLVVLLSHLHSFVNESVYFRVDILMHRPHNARNEPFEQWRTFATFRFRLISKVKRSRLVGLGRRGGAEGRGKGCGPQGTVTDVQNLSVVKLGAAKGDK